MRIMSAIISAVFKATIGLIVDKGRDVAAERMKEGDVADQKFRSLIVRDLKEIHNTLDVLSHWINNSWTCFVLVNSKLCFGFI